MATTIAVGNRRTARPGAYSVINGSALSRREPGIRRLLLIGTAEGGTPLNEKTDGLPTFLAASSPGGVRDLFRGGNLRIAGLLGFDASNDPEIGSPSSILFAKVNPATQAALTLTNVDGDALELTSVAWGEFANLARFTLGAGTTQGYSVEISQEDDTETGDDIGGDTVMTVIAANPAWLFNHFIITEARLIAESTGVRVTHKHACADAAKVTSHNSGETVKVFSSNAYDTVQRVTVYGISVGGVAMSETLTLNGVSNVAGTAIFGKVTGMTVDGATRGIIRALSATGVAPAYLLDDIVATLTANHDEGAVEIVSSNAADTGTIVVTGTAPSGVHISETLALDGTTPVAGTKTFTKVLTARLLSAQVGTVTVRAFDGAKPVAFTIAPTKLTAGINLSASVLFMADPTAFTGTQLIDSDGFGTAVYVVVRGADTTGAAAAEVVNLAVAAVTTTTAWSRIDHVEIAENPDVTRVVGNAINALHSRTPYLGQVASAINGHVEYEATTFVDGPSTWDTARLDLSDANCFNVTASLMADLDAIESWINANSQIVTAERATGATGAPTMGGPTYLIGGSEGVATNAHWQAAFDAAKRLRDVVIVPVSSSASIHAMLVSHLRYMEGAGNNEREGWIGMASSLTKSQIKTAIKALNDRNTAALAQTCDVYDEAGDRVTYEPEFLAVIMGAMQAAAEPGLPLLRKLPKVIAVGQNASWDPFEDFEEVVQFGLCLIETDDTVGPRVGREVTTWRNDDNPIFTAVGANGSANESSRRLRAQLDLVIGDRAFDGRAASLKSSAAAELDRQVAGGVIKAWEPSSLTVIDQGDTFSVEVEIAPMEGVVFVLTTLNLRRIPASA